MTMLPKSSPAYGRARPRPRFSAALLVLSMAVWAVFGLTACGIKPAELDPPAGSDYHYFPQTYPHPATDPQPR